MRVALFTETFLPKVDGIVTRLSFTIAELQRQGVEVLVFAPGSGPTEFMGARVIRIPGAKCPLYPELTLALPRPSIRAELVEFRPDVIHVADPAVLGVGGIYYADVLERPLVISYHTRIQKYVHYYGLGALEPLVWTLMRMRHKKADLNLCTSTAMVEDLASNGIERIALWPPAVDTDTFHPRFRSEAVRARLSHTDPRDPLLIYAGRLSPEKNVEGIRRVLEEIPEAQLAIVGNGPHRSKLQKYFAGTKTVFTGYLRGQDLASAFASADLLILPSRTETLGLVLLEAMASACAVAGANAGGIPDIVHDGETGFLFDPSDKEDLVRVVRGALSDPEALAIIAQSGRDFAEQLNWAAATTKLKSFYANVMGSQCLAQNGRPGPKWKTFLKKTALGSLKSMLFRARSR